jgi:hypothetical protein
MPTICLRCGKPIPHERYAEHARSCNSYEIRLRMENSDLRWLLGRLALFAPDDVMLPPRLAPLLLECIEGFDASRFTVATPIGEVRS